MFCAVKNSTKVKQEFDYTLKNKFRNAINYFQKILIQK